jgi:Na+/proline symporter/CheY-like chemotaxis protein/nitrogen-specific signal transduction histidine kinase
MLQGWVVVGFALAYIGFLFAVASYGDRARPTRGVRSSRPWIYPLSLAVYCTSWTFFGSVGLSAAQGFDFLTIYIGPVLMMVVGFPLILKIVRLAKTQNITSIADFIAARYGKNQIVAAIVTVVAVIGAVPYIALQLKAVSASLLTILGQQPSVSSFMPMFGDLALLVAVAMAAFAVLFGTRHIDATEHQEGLMLAIATESLIKLVAFLVVGLFVTFYLFNGPMDLIAKAERANVLSIFTNSINPATWLTMTVLSLLAIVLLPRQFHVMVVENNGEDELRRAVWLFPLYLVLINLFVVPIAMAGLITFPARNVDSDMFVLALPLTANADLLALLAFIGGLSAATAMVIVESVAVAIMVSNDIVVPLVLRRRGAATGTRDDMGALLLRARRFSIFCVLLLAYLYYRIAGEAQLAQIGLLSFAAVAQFGPAFFGGLFWRRANARGAIAGLAIGVGVWAYTLLLPSFVAAGLLDRTILDAGLFGITDLRPQALFGLEAAPLTHGVFWSLGLNILAFIAVSLFTSAASIERLQANIFVEANSTPITPSFRLWRSSVTVEELISTVSRYLGEERTRRSFESDATTRGMPLDPRREADIHSLRYAEHLLASAIGAASSRLVLSLLLRKGSVSPQAALKLLDDASAAIHYNREILQNAIDHVQEGIAVFDRELRLICWNRQFGEMLALPPDVVRLGVGLDEILRAGTERGDFGPGHAANEFVADRLERYVLQTASFRERFVKHGIVVEVRSNRLPDDGIVVTYTDITPTVEAADALERANETLERRVKERTEELTRLNAELARAKSEADDANISKTRFLAAASHDILQPLNAARLYATSLVERQRQGDDAKLATNIDASLEAVEEILGALLEISRLDTGAMQPEVSVFQIDDIFGQLEVEFAPLAAEKGLELTFVPSSLAVRSDRRLLRRLLQNLVSNAIKYTPKGRVLVGCRRRGKHLSIRVIDTGMGVPASKQKIIFKEFQRLEQGAKAARGLGLGLSIVERIARVLGHKVSLRSAPNEGSTFAIELPVAPAVPDVERSRSAAMTPAAPLEGVVVLCIENEPQVLAGMDALLTGWGCQVLAAPDLETALTAIRESGSRPDALLVDYHLDEGNGVDAIVALRQQLDDDLPAALVTADRSPAVRERARAREIQVFNKPVKPAAIRAFLAQWRVARPAAE